MRVLQVYPINKKNEMPSSWRLSQINSLKKHVNIFLYPVLKRRRILDLLKFGVDLRKNIKKNKIDLIHCQWGSSMAFICSVFSSVPVVISFCGSDLLGNYSVEGKLTFSGKISVCLSKVASYFSSYNIVKSKALFRNIPKKCQYKTSIVPNGVDSNHFFKTDKEVARKKLNLPLDKKIILFVNSIGAWEKNPEFARKIGEKIEEDKEFVYLEISNISSDLMPLYYSSADFLLITSFHEGSSNVLKESLFCGLKVITTPTGDSKERLEGIEGCLISSNLEEIVLHIKKYKDKKLIIKDSILGKVELSEVALKIYMIYQKILKNKR